MARIDYFELSRSTLEELSGQGDTEAMIALALGLYFGSFGEMDAGSAFDWFSEAYKMGEMKAAPFLAEMIYFRQVSISGFDSDEDYRRRAYELYKEGEEKGMVAAIRGICKMMIRGDYLEEDIDGAYERLKELEDEDEECAHLVGLLEDGTLTDDDIIPCNEFGVDDEDDGEADGDEGVIRRWLEKDTPFLAFHVSGGTTEALWVSPKHGKLEVELAASSLDLKGGQAVDRVGGMLGLPFPSGKYLARSRYLAICSPSSIVYSYIRLSSSAPNV